MPSASEVDKSKAEPETQPKTEALNLQPVVDKWISAQPATYAIMVYDPAAGEAIGSNLETKEFFAASLYKLFVAYLALIDFQSGAQNPHDVIVAGQTRQQCVDKMIRSSDSPCGEAMMAAMNRSTIEQKLANMGITNTDFNDLMTTAKDVAVVFEYIHKRRHLNQPNTALLRDALLNQPQMYKNGLAKGAPQAKVYSKVGWNEQHNYHDAGLMALPDGREFVVVILSQGNGRSAPIADFSSTIYSALTR